MVPAFYLCGGGQKGIMGNGTPGLVDFQIRIVHCSLEIFQLGDFPVIQKQMKLTCGNDKCRIF